MIERLKKEYMLLSDNGKEHQIITLCFMWMFFPAISLEKNRVKILRMLGLLLSFPWMVVTIPISGVLFFFGFCQVVWQEI